MQCVLPPLSEELQRPSYGHQMNNNKTEQREKRGRFIFLSSTLSEIIVMPMRRLTPARRGHAAVCQKRRGQPHLLLPRTHADTAFPMNSLIVSFSKELSAAAARPHVPRMWALDRAQRPGRKGAVQRGAGVSAWGRNRPDGLARRPVTQTPLGRCAVW